MMMMTAEDCCQIVDPLAVSRTAVPDVFCIVANATGNSRESGIPKFPAGIPGNFLILGGNFREFQKFNFI